ncbi:MAG TPA: hypothetical protein VMG33_03305 [Steroidobacteraceae bacterium]|nr:hypothetical protein [Steroidobacteraceae bacterium]
MSERFTFLSQCPRCGRERAQGAHARAELAQLLEDGAEIEAHCSSCDASWPVPVEERADLARLLG